MKKKGIAILAAAVLTGVLLSGCAGNGSAAAGSVSTAVGADVASQGDETAQGDQLAPGDKTVQGDKTAPGDQSAQGDKTAPGDQSAQKDQSASQSQEAALEDGTYTVDFDTDSSMFHVSEACEGKGTLTVTDGSMMLHISLPSKNIVNLFPGLAKDAKKDGAEILEPTTDTVTYSDGMTEEVYGFDVPVPVLEEEFDLALLGKKGQWYDHKASVSHPVKTETAEGSHGKSDETKEAVHVELEDGTYTVEVTLGGGSGRAGIISPASMYMKDGTAYARIEWSSSNYDYMKIGNETCLPVETEGNSVFEIPVSVFDEEIPVIADTTAMSTPHEIEYSLTFHLDSVKKN